MLKRTVVFLILNFGALALGSLYTSDGVASDWYTTLNKAPWTPPGWMFGAAWTTIMICFSLYMAWVWKSEKNHKLLTLIYAIQLVLNISWNPLFFYFQKPVIALIAISLLTLTVGTLLFRYVQVIRFKSLGILPYFLWLLIATSLNAYIVCFN